MNASQGGGALAWTPQKNDTDLEIPMNTACGMKALKKVAFKSKVHPGVRPAQLFWSATQNPAYYPAKQQRHGKICMCSRMGGLLGQEEESCMVWHEEKNSRRKAASKGSMKQSCD